MNKLEIGGNGVEYGVKDEDGKRNLYASDLNGEIIWSKELPQDYTSINLKVAPDGNLYVLSGNSRILCFAPDGEEIWRYNLTGDKNEGLTDNWAWGPGGTFYFCSNTRLFAINPDGK